jgi:hypothetical protein
VGQGTPSTQQFDYYNIQRCTCPLDLNLWPRRKKHVFLTIKLNPFSILLPPHISLIPIILSSSFHTFSTYEQDNNIYSIITLNFLQKNHHVGPCILLFCIFSHVRALLFRVNYLNIPTFKWNLNFQLNLHHQEWSPLSQINIDANPCIGTSFLSWFKLIKLS